MTVVAIHVNRVCRCGQLVCASVAIEEHVEQKELVVRQSRVSSSSEKIVQLKRAIFLPDNADDNREPAQKLDRTKNAKAGSAVHRFVIRRLGVLHLETGQVGD